MSSPRIASQVRWFAAERSAIVLNLTTGRYYRLNATAAEIWDGLSKCEPLAVIQERISQDHKVSPESAKVDLSDFIENLQRVGLVE
jgi:hypothetical protein